MRAGTAPLGGIWRRQAHHRQHYAIRKWVSSLASRGRIDSHKAVLLIYNAADPCRSYFAVERFDERQAPNGKRH